MNDSLADPPRWRDGNGQIDLAERTAGHAFRCAAVTRCRPAPPLSRVAARIHGSRRPRRLAWVMVATAFILGLATAASAAHFDLLPAWLMSVVRPKAPVPARQAPRRSRTRTAQPAAVSSPAPTPAPAGVEPAASPGPEPVAAPVVARAPIAATSRGSDEPRSAPRRVALAEPDHGQARPSPSLPVPNPAQVVATAPNTERPPESLAGDSIPVAPVAPVGQPGSVALPPSPTPVPVAALGRPAQASPPARPGAGSYLADTVHLLRKQRSPAAALRLLGEHEAELAQAGFAHEALILRVEALLALGRATEALRLLDGASLTDVAASRALLVTRGELRAAASRCAEGLGDFELVLARSRQLDRQALAGRALCRRRLGDEAGADADLQRLRQEFPNYPVRTEPDK